MKKLNILNISNTLIKIVFFVMFPAAWVTGFSGVKYLCQQIRSGKPLEANAFVIVLVSLTLFTILFGRFFCGRACAFGTYGDVLHEIGRLAAKKMKKKLRPLPEKAESVLRYLKYIVLLAVCLACAFGHDNVVSKLSPWTAFSNIGNTQGLTADISAIIGLALLIVLSGFMIFTERFFCRFLCPFGAVFSLLPVLPYAQVRRSKADCIKGCKACKSICPAGLDLQYLPAAEPELISENEKDYAAKMGECFQCGKCAHICPRSNAGSIVLRSGRAGIVIDIIKAVVLAALLYFVV